ncbi:protein containing DUF192 [mine drainage metagenome]|uniref:Protein containing DUF192 n=1 Tax=mine drainage metagenome TaxID=410659 RepID=T1AN84_9ZZZZ
MVGLLHFLQKRQRYREARVGIGKYELTVEVSDTFIKRMIGLMYRDSLAKDHGMLFDFFSAGRYGIWMHNMRFPIDVLWVGSDMRVVDTLSSAQVCRSIFRCKTYRPGMPARYVIELPSGYIYEKKIAVGTIVTIKGYQK